MEHFDIAEYLTEEVDFLKKEGQKVGFVPTMGALHEGHLSLVRRSAQENDTSVVSIFVNPTQFNNPDDLTNYPRTLISDSEMLESVGTGILFAPGEQEIYPDNFSRTFAPSVDLGVLDIVMEGGYRPGHFKGVVQVVHRLFEIVKPDVAYFGEKDFQQLAVIRRMVEQLDLPVRIIACPTCREPDGLAMSSRNVRLSTAERAEAPVIYRALRFIRDHRDSKSFDDLKTEAIRMIESSGRIKVEYLELADAETLLPVADLSSATHIRSFVSAYLGKVRLIDNEVVKQN